MLHTFNKSDDGFVLNMKCFSDLNNYTIRNIQSILNVNKKSDYLSFIFLFLRDADLRGRTHLVPEETWRRQSVLM